MACEDIAQFALGLNRPRGSRRIPYRLRVIPMIPEKNGRELSSSLTAEAIAFVQSQASSGLWVIHALDRCPVPRRRWLMSWL